MAIQWEAAVTAETVPGWDASAPAPPSPPPACPCPHLGLRHDRATHAAFPSSAHCCWRTASPVRVDQVAQASVCLVASHLDCPRYQDAAAPAPRHPGDHRRARRDHLVGRLVAGAVTLALIVLVVLVVAWRLAA